MDSRLPILLPLLTLALYGCSSTVRDGAPTGYPDLSHTPDAVPRVEPISRSNQKPYTVFGRTYRPMSSSAGYVEKGVASWYGNKFHGNDTANGEPYNMYTMSAAHKYLPLPTYVQVRNLENGRTATVRVNDRGPFHGNRVIDLSYAAASKLGMLRKGTALVEVRAIDPHHPQQALLARAPSTPVKLGTKQGPRIYLQVGAFSDAANADRLQQRLEQYLKRPVRVEPFQNQGRTLHRVQIGPLASVEIADRVSDRLETIDIYQTHMLLR